MKNFSKEEIEFIKKSISEGKLRVEISKLLHVGVRRLKRECELLGITLPEYTHHNLCLTNPFENMSNPDTLYWLGWIATDGYVGNDVLRLGISEKDIDVLQKFNEYLGGNLKIHHNIHHNKFHMVSIQTKSKKIVEYLHNLGFSCNKTFEFYPTFNIDWNYIRGVFEGDGYIREKEISIVSACKKHIDVLNAFFIEHNFHPIVKLHDKYTKNPVYTISLYRKQEIGQFIDNIYKGTDVFMNRKRSLARAIRNNC